MRSSHLAVALASLSISLAACGGDDDGVSVAVDARANIDSAAVPCTGADYGDKGALTGNAYFDPDSGPAGDPDSGAMDDLLEFVAPVEAGMPFDAVDVLLYAGYGAFMGGPIRTGTFPISGAELSFADCGVCVVVSTDITQGDYADDYMATGGTVTVTAVGTGIGQTFTGSLSNVTFQHATIAMGASTPINDGCTARLGNATFSGTLAAPPAM